MTKQQSHAQGQEQVTQQYLTAIALDQLDKAEMRLLCARAMLKFIEYEMHESDEGLGMSHHVIGDAIHGIGLLMEDAQNALASRDHE